MSTYYLSGPMTGLPDLNYPAFRNAALELRALGHTVYNPADWERRDTLGSGQFRHVEPRKFDLALAFSDYCEFIIYDADAVAVLPGWENSPGATAEAYLAWALGKPVFGYLDGALTPLTRPVPAVPSALAPACPDHVERQHRDMQPPWCPHCGWNRTDAKKYGRSRSEADADRLGPTP